MLRKHVGERVVPGTGGRQRSLLIAQGFPRVTLSFPTSTCTIFPVIRQGLWPTRRKMRLINIQKTAPPPQNKQTKETPAEIPQRVHMEYSQLPRSPGAFPRAHQFITGLYPPLSIAPFCATAEAQDVAYVFIKHEQQ